MTYQMDALNIACGVIKHALSSKVVESRLLRLKFKAN